MSVKNPRLA